MYNPKSSHAEEFIDHGEIMETLEYAAKNRSNRALIEEIINGNREYERNKDVIHLNHGQRLQFAATFQDCRLTARNGQQAHGWCQHNEMQGVVTP